MTIASGTRLGPYEIVESIGAGGMGEVWRARDTRLDREVAIKVLPAGFAEDDQFLQRFEREARTISSLNHPHICTLFDVGEAALDRAGEAPAEPHAAGPGLHYLVMELIEGESLADRLKKGPLPLHDVLKYGRQIASALDAAHRKGVIHRDLKPGNIMLTKSGAKLLDFGLAKSAAEGGGPIDGLTSMPTEAKPLTREGTILGTFQYMAPEQLEGLEADARTDIFAFGALLYEMATGRRAFQGETKTSLIAAIVSQQPEPISQVTPMSPPALDHVVRRCLEKDPDDRWQSAHDIASELQWISEAGSQAGVATPVTIRRKTRERLAWSVATVATLIATVFGVLWWLNRPPEEKVERFSISLSGGDRVDLSQTGLALSPDGAFLVYSADDGNGASRLYTHRIGELDPTPLPATDGGAFPFFSPDGRQVGFFADSKLRRISLSGGAAQTICDAPAGRGGTWGPDGTIVFSSGGLSGGGVLSRVPARGGTPTELTTLDGVRHEFSHRWPWFLPDGKHVLFVAQTGEGTAIDDRSTIEAVSVDSLERTMLLRANSSVQFVPTGHILYWSEGAVIAQPFDPTTLVVSGSPFPVAEGVAYGALEFGAFAASGNGSLVFQTGEPETSRLELYDRDGSRLQVVTDTTGTIVSPRLSPDGSRIAYGIDGDIWVRDLVRGTAIRLTFDPGEESDPIWSPDGQWIAFVSNQEGLSVRRKKASGIGEAESIYIADTDATGLYTSEWSKRGDAILLTLDPPDQLMDIGKLNIDDGSLEMLITTPFIEADPSLSPDGQWLLLTSNATGRMEVYVYGLGEASGQWQISQDGGGFPSWSGDGRRIYYIGGEWPIGSDLMVVAVQPGDPFQIGTPVEIMSVNPRKGRWAPYDVNADETRFVWNAQIGGIHGPQPLTLVRNWQRLLE